MEKYQVIFLDAYRYKTPYTKKHFNSKIEAKRWAENNQWGDEDYEYDEYENLLLYYNPEDQNSYIDYEIKTIDTLNEEFIRMQKLAGLLNDKQP